MTAAEALARVRIVLVGPLYSGNVGSVCRAMANMGLRELTIAAPSVPLNLEEARRMACHAAPLLESLRTEPDLAAAVHDCHRVVGTTARGGLYRRHARPVRDVAHDLLRHAALGPIALVFGREDNGLSNEELTLCTELVQIPTTPEFSSLNLAQATLVCAYELFVAGGDYRPPEEKAPVAPSRLRERMLEFWREALLEIGFMEEGKADHMMLGLRRIVGRGALTVDDVNILLGIARQTLWASRQHGRHSASD